jgi:hypothetical protein
MQDNMRLITRAAELWKPLGTPGFYGDMNDQTWLELLEFVGPSVDFDRARIKEVYTSSLIPDASKADVQGAKDLANSANK